MESILAVKQRFGIIGDNPKLNRAIEKSFQVERSEVTVPAAKIKSINEIGVVTCLRDNSIVNSEEECAQVDTTFSDCFKITSTTNMTMMGSGVEYGQKVYTWLAKDHGVVKSDLYMRWTENPYSDTSANGEVDELSLIHI